MTYFRVIWNPPGTPFPEHHDFRYEATAEHFAGILREIGHQHVTTHHLNSTEQRETR